MSGGLEGGLRYWGPGGFGSPILSPYLEGLKTFGKGMAIVGAALDFGVSVCSNFNNPNYSLGQAIGATAMDAAYYTGKGLGMYWLGSQIGGLAVTLGSAAVSSLTLSVGLYGALIIGGGAAVAVGIAGAVAIYYLGEGIDWIYEQIKEGVFG